MTTRRPFASMMMARRKSGSSVSSARRTPWMALKPASPMGASAITPSTIAMMPSTGLAGGGCGGIGGIE